MEVGSLFCVFYSAPDPCVVELQVDLYTAWEGTSNILGNPPFPTLNLQILKPELKEYLRAPQNLLVIHGECPKVEHKWLVSGRELSLTNRSDISHC